MPTIRSVLLRRPALLAALLFCATIARILVPAGFMPVTSGGAVTLQPCPGTMPAPAAAIAGMHHGGAKHESPPRAEQPCAFTGLAAPALGTADAVPVAATLAFPFLLAVTGGAPVAPAAPARLRPPLRAPPFA